ncbi:MAG: ABC transporter ATP-binding protein [Lentisphaeraceae bacterium]|nr:ABC transporter ATP-binding protein [Lentisphaeraceae bacterium]
MSNYVKEHYLDLVNLSKVYPTKKGPFVVLENFNLTVPEGEFVCLIGHSGCGKSTILTMVAGLNSISNGSVSVAGHEIDGPGPDRGVVFQSPSLLPWLSAYDNVMLGVSKVYPHASKKEREDIVKHYLNAVGLGGAFHKMPKELSQGMRQRVGIARAFALKPKMMLLDEPLGMLDALTKHELQDLIAKLHAEHKLTTLMVTHDVDEALYLSDRVVMMTNGPKAKVGQILLNDMPRPRERVSLLEYPNYYKYREQLITFLEEQELKKKHTAA